MAARWFLLCTCLALGLSPLFASPPRIAVGDFTVTSDDPRLKYVGKGLAEMVAAELGQSKDVLLIDRENARPSSESSSSP